MALATGTRVSDSVTLVRPLGRGGMGSVWVARHEKLDTDVAVKFVSAELAQKDGSVLARFKREAALSAKIQSPHVVKTFDHGVMDDGRPYLVMELLRGETLGEYLARHEVLGARHTVTVVSQIAAVLDEAHALGVVHRDIKPDNVFLIDAGYDLFVKVLDFGIAKQTSVPKVSDVTSTGAIVGTPEYMSPEQLLSTRSADHRSDLWSLGVLTYHAIVGRVPFTGETLPSLSLSICNADYDPPSEVADVPFELDGWFERALEPDPNNRFQSAGEMAAELRRILLGDEPPVESRPRPGSGRDVEVVSDPDVDPQADTIEKTGARAVATGDRPSDGLRAPGTPSIAGAAAELVPSAATATRRRSALMIAVTVLSALTVAVAADLVLRRTLLPRPANASPMTRSSGDPWDDDEPPTRAHPAPIIRAEPPAPSPAPAPSDAPSSKPSSDATEPSRPPPVDSARTTGGPRPPPPVSSVKPGCENPFQLDKDGLWVPKLECL